MLLRLFSKTSKKRELLGELGQGMSGYPGVILSTMMVDRGIGISFPGIFDFLRISR